MVLIKEAMTIDLLSGGRLEFGLGAGWIKEEYSALGITMDSPGKRIDRLGDVIAGAKAYATGVELSIDNETLNWHEFQGVPKPAQKPYPRIMVGGGSPKVLRLAGREADIVSLNFNNRSGILGPDGVQSSSSAETHKKIGWIKEGAGDRFDQLEIEIGAYFAFVMDNPETMIETFAKMNGFTNEEMVSYPHALFGSVETVCEELQRRREEYGISYITIGEDAMEAFAPVVAKLSGK